jgi:hypothetical protein
MRTSVLRSALLLGTVACGPSSGTPTSPTPPFLPTTSGSSDTVTDSRVISGQV